MSTSIDQAFVRQYESDVHEAFQRRGSKLRPFVRLKTGVVGESTTFQYVGTGMATTKARHGQITPMNQDHTPVLCSVTDFYAGDWVDKLDELKINIQERMVVANAGAWALGRMVDNQILTAMNGTTSTGVTWDDSSEAAIRNSLLEMIREADAADVPDDGDRYGVLTPTAWAMASTVEEWNSSDYVNPGDRNTSSLGSYQIKRWGNVKWMQHSGLPGVGTATAKVYLFHRTAVGYAEGMGVTADITWHGDRAAHFVNNMMSGGACLIDHSGVIEGTLDDTAALPTTV